MARFLDKSAALDTQWRSIILLGQNSASYKFALGKALLDFSDRKSAISLEELALPFAKNICTHLKTQDKQNTRESGKFLDACRAFNRNEIEEDQLKIETVKLGFVNVIDAFHNVQQSEVSRFFIDNRKTDKTITLTDNFFQLRELDSGCNLLPEVEARWRLWETAISIGVNSRLLEIQRDPINEQLFILKEKKRRIDVTSSKEALNGYQKGRCFYCPRPITVLTGTEYSCDVDHFFPHSLADHGFTNVDGVWNLVLTCIDCNRGPAGKFQQIPNISYLTRLDDRNNFFIESHHPLRETIINQTGSTQQLRQSFLQKRYDEATTIFPGTQKWMPRSGLLNDSG